MVFNYMKIKRTRTVLTIFGIMLGPAAIVALLGLMGGFGVYLTSELSSIGVTTVYVMPASNFTLNSGVVSQISSNSYVKAALPYYSTSGSIDYDGNTESATIYATNISELGSIMPGLKLQSGTLLSTGSSPTFADIGYSIAYPNITGVKNLTLNQVVTVNLANSKFSSSSTSSSTSKAQSFLVKGIYSNFGLGIFVDPDTSLFIPISGATLITSNPSSYTGLILEAHNVSDVNRLSTAL